MLIIYITGRLTGSEGQVTESYQQRAGRSAATPEPSVDPRDEKLRADIEDWWDKHKYKGTVGVEPFYELAKIIRGEITKKSKVPE
jgi:hypothetical protein